jgi:SAM-dependent methyltransferase
VALDLGSADGPSAGWIPHVADHVVSLDIDPRGLSTTGICGSAMALPFADETFDLVSAFDVIEHCEPEATALAEVARVLRPGGSFLMAVPAYRWAWSDHDVANGHHRRYTRARAAQSVGAAGLTIDRVTHGFATVFPFFAAERLVRRLRRGRTEAQDIAEIPQVPLLLNSALTRLSRLDSKVLARADLPFGSSVFLAAHKPSKPPTETHQ